MAENITAHMDKSLESLKHNFSKVRTGRANANILSDITVDYYGVPTPVTQVAAVKTPEAHMLLIEPWDKALINAIVKVGKTDARRGVGKVLDQFMLVVLHLRSP